MLLWFVPGRAKGGLALGKRGKSWEPDFRRIIEGEAQVRVCVLRGLVK